MRFAIMWITLAYFLILQYNFSRADEVFVGYGVGIMNDANYYFGQNKYIDVGYRDFIWNGLYWQTKAGYWGEGSPDKGRKAGFWGSTGPGLEVDLHPIEIRSGWGIAAISAPDSQLGGHTPQFNGNLSLGFRDRHGDSIAVEYDHISSAGLVTPNIGRDFILIELSTKW